MSLFSTRISGFSAFERMVAWRYLFARKKEGVMSLITTISFVGIMLGVAALIVVMAVMNGFREELITRLLGLNGHIVVQPIREDGFENYDRLVKSFNTLGGVKLALPLIEGQVLIRGTKAGSGTGAFVRGIRKRDLERLDLVSGNIKQGNIGNFDNEGGVLIGQGMASALQLSVGDFVTLLSPEGDVTLMGTLPRVKSYPVRGIFEVGMYDYDSSFIYMPFEESQVYFNKEKNAKFIEIYLNDPQNTASVKKQIAKNIQETVLVSDWQERNSTVFGALQVERNVMFVILSLIIVVAALNIISGLVMLVKEKGYDIAILRTTGARQGSILRIFFMTGAMIGFSGTAAGILLGYIVCINIESIRQFLSDVFGTVLFDPEFYLLSEIPAVINSTEVFWVITMALSLSFFASIIPAWSASRLDPVEALR